MPRAQKDTDKQKALRQHGTLNPRPQDVRHPLFRDSEFFDPEDMIQVKYEMLRRVQADQLQQLRGPIGPATADYIERGFEKATSRIVVGIVGDTRDMDLRAAAPKPITTIINTHCHGDHVSGNANIRAIP